MPPIRRHLNTEERKAWMKRIRESLEELKNK